MSNHHGHPVFYILHLWEASADVPDDGTADFVDVDWGDGDLEAGPEAEQKAAGVQLPHLHHKFIIRCYFDSRPSSHNVILIISGRSYR